MPADSQKDYVFRPDLNVATSGIVTSEGASAAFVASLNDASALQPLKQNLLKLWKQLTEKDVLCMSESDYAFSPLMVPLPEGHSGTLDPVAVLKLLGAHQQLQDSASECGLAALMSNDDDGSLRQQILSLLGGESNALIFECGESLLNPMPVLVVAPVDGLLVGFMTAKVYT
jgi:hypothetical protein